MKAARLKCSQTGTCVHGTLRPRPNECKTTTCSAQVQNGVVEQSYPRSPFVTGGRFGTSGSSRSLVPADRLPLLQDKQIIFVRHGTTTWNAEKRIQGSSDESHLTEFGREQVCVLCVSPKRAERTVVRLMAYAGSCDPPVIVQYFLRLAAVSNCSLLT